MTIATVLAAEFPAVPTVLTAVAVTGSILIFQSLFARQDRAPRNRRQRVVRVAAALSLAASLGFLGHSWVAGDTLPEWTAAPAPHAAVAALPLMVTAPVPVIVAAPAETSPEPTTSQRDQHTAKPGVPGVPTGIRIPSLAVTAPIVVTESPGGVFQVPDDIQTVGWDQATRRPGARQGTALMAGHRDAPGREGALYDLARLIPGDTVVVTTTRGRLRYEVTSVRNYRKDGLPNEIVAPTGGHRVALVTCGGPLVRGDDGYLHYRDNTVAWLSPVTP